MRGAGGECGGVGQRNGRAECRRATFRRGQGALPQVHRYCASRATCGVGDHDRDYATDVLFFFFTPPPKLIVARAQLQSGAQGGGDQGSARGDRRRTLGVGRGGASPHRKRAQGTGRGGGAGSEGEGQQLACLRPANGADPRVLRAPGLLRRHPAAARRDRGRWTHRRCGGGPRSQPTSDGCHRFAPPPLLPPPPAAARPVRYHPFPHRIFV